MKYLILLLFCTISYSQTQYIITSLDVRNTITGSNPTNNKSEIDILFTGGVTDKNGITIEIGYENFKAIEFQKLYFGVGYTYISNKISIALLVEPTAIRRDWGRPDINNMWYNTIGSTLRITYNITEHFGISISENVLLRMDNADRWDIHPPKVYSIYLGINYKF